MGCTPNRQLKYSHESDDNHIITTSYSSNANSILLKKPSIFKGSKNYIHPQIGDYETELENYKNKTVINEILTSLDKNPNLEALGYRKQLGKFCLFISLLVFFNIVFCFFFF